MCYRAKVHYGKFKDTVNMLGIEKFWCAYRDECMRIFAEDWCRKILNTKRIVNGIVNAAAGNCSAAALILSI